MSIIQYPVVRAATIQNGFVGAYVRGVLIPVVIYDGIDYIPLIIAKILTGVNHRTSAVVFKDVKRIYASDLTMRNIITAEFCWNNTTFVDFRAVYPAIARANKSRPDILYKIKTAAVASRLIDATNNLYKARGCIATKVLYPPNQSPTPLTADNADIDDENSMTDADDDDSETSQAASLLTGMNPRRELELVSRDELERKYIELERKYEQLQQQITTSQSQDQYIEFL